MSHKVGQLSDHVFLDGVAAPVLQQAVEQNFDQGAVHLKGLRVYVCVFRPVTASKQTVGLAVTKKKETQLMTRASWKRAASVSAIDNIYKQHCKMNKIVPSRPTHPPAHSCTHRYRHRQHRNQPLPPPKTTTTCPILSTSTP